MIDIINRSAKSVLCTYCRPLNTRNFTINDYSEKFLTDLRRFKRASRSKLSAIDITFPSVCLQRACTHGTVLNYGEVCCSWQRTFCTIYLTPDTDRPGTWIGCKRNRSKIFATFFPNISLYLGNGIR